MDGRLIEMHNNSTELPINADKLDFPCFNGIIGLLKS